MGNARIISKILISVGVCLLICLHGAAQNGGLPLILNIDNDLWSWQPGEISLNRVTEWGYNYSQQPSPDGTQVAFLSLPQLSVEIARENPTLEFAALFSNVWILDVPTGRLTQVAHQPEDAAYPDNGLQRLAPSWSPDGRYLAWLEYDGKFISRLMTFDMQTRSTQALVENVEAGWGQIIWLKEGPVIEWWDTPLNEAPQTHYLAYDNAGQLQTTWHLPVFEYAEGMVLTYRDAGYLARQPQTEDWDNSTWEIINLKTRIIEPAPGPPEKVALMNPDRSLRLRMEPPGYMLAGSWISGDLNILDAAGNLVVLPLNADEEIYQAVLSPDGRAVALHVQNTTTSAERLVVWRDEKVLTIALPPDVREITWGAMVWQIPR